MRTTRVLLVVTAAVTLAGFAGSMALADAARGGDVPVGVVGFLGLLVGLGAIAAAVVSFIHAQQQQRSCVGWAVGGLLFPYAAPLVLAALPAAGGVTVSAEEQAATLRSVLVGKWVCPCGVVREEGREGEVCSTCGTSLMRFVAAEPGQRCSSCGFLFSDAAVRMEERMTDVWSRKGFRCSSCGRPLCLSCLPSGEDGSPGYRCDCGGGLAIRV